MTPGIRTFNRELDYLIYNDPAAYAEMVLNGDVKKDLDTVWQG